MNNLVYLLIAYVVFLILALFISLGDLASPSVLFFGSFCVMFFLARVYQWYFRFAIKTSTMWIILGAGLAFILTEYLYKCTRHRVHKKMVYREPVSLPLVNEAVPITISKQTQRLIIVFMMIVTVASYYRIVRWASGGTWGEQVLRYETLIRSDNYSSPVPVLDVFVAQTARIAKALVYVICYSVIYNKILCGVKFRRQIPLLIILALYIPMTVISGARQPTVELVIFCMLIYVILKKVSRKSLKIIRFAIIAMTLLAIFFPLFTSATSIVGGTNIKRDALRYVTTYLCGGLKNFDELIVGNPCSTKYFGQSTFSGIYEFLIRKIHILPPEEDLSYHAVGFFGDTSITTFGRWYEDFGAPGVIVMTMLVSLFFSWLHDRSMAHRAPNLTHIIYVQQAMALVLASYDDRVSPLISVSNVITLLLMLIFYRCLARGGKYHFVFGGKRIRFKLGGDQN